MRNQTDRAFLLGILPFAALLVLSCSASWAAEVPPSWLSQARQNVVDAEYAITQQGAAWQAANRAHGLRTTFAPEGVRLVPRLEQDSSWAWGLTLAGVGRPGAVTPVEPALLRVDGKRITYDRGGIVEWYVNDARGLEQGFTLAGPASPVRGEVFIELALTGTLDPIVSGDGQAIDFRAPGGAVVLHYDKLVVTDARGHTLTSRMEGFAAPGVRGIRLVFNDHDAAYPITVDPLLSSWSWSASSNQNTAWFGYSVATAGDVNGDGFSDVIVGAPFYDNGQSDEGRAFVYLGTASGLAAAHAWTAEGDQINANFGWSVASAGDVNGDGFSEVIVGATNFENGQAQEGRAFVFMGSASGLATTAAWTAEGNQLDAYFGTVVAPAGDVNGDGYADVIVSSPDYDSTATNRGRVFVYLGSASGLSATAAWTKDGAQDARFGSSAATAGDVNGDGYADVVIGADSHDTDQIFEGRAYVYLGSSSGLAATAGWTAEGNSVGAHFGYSVSTAGDVNGDGYADVIVGAEAFSNGQSGEGRALVYLGSAAGLATTHAWAVESDIANARCGTSVATAGDVNGDGFADVVVGSPRDDGTIGSIDLYLGSAAGLSTAPVWFGFPPNEPGKKFGFSVGTAGDVNGDGYSDFIVGAYLVNDGQFSAGAAFVYVGSASGLTAIAGWTAESDKSGANFGVSVASAGDVNGDGYSDVIVGAAHYGNGPGEGGRAYVYLGSASGLATTAVWTADGDQGNDKFGFSVGTAGDVNGDGYSDVIVGAPMYDHGQIEEGRAYVYLGSASGYLGLAWIAESDQASAYFGWSVATAGDVNGDGYSDVIVGAYRYDYLQSGDGRLYVYLGSASGLATNATWTAYGDQAGAGLGVSVAPAGDVNGDGYSDVIVGTGSAGRANTYFGSASGLAASAAWTTVNGQGSNSASVATAGDVNGDGYADVIVGVGAYANLQVNEGRAVVYLGSAAGLATTAAWTVESNQAEAYFGLSAASAGDVNGDGYSDVIVGAYGYDNGQLDEGGAFVYLGSSAGLATTVAWPAESDQASARFGMSVGTAGDVNGDGFADVIVGADAFNNGQSYEGRAFVYYGGGGDGLDRIPRQVRTDGATAVALSGRSDSESEFRLRVRARTPAGRGRVRLQWEAKPLGTSFNGAATGVSAEFLTGPPGAAGSAANLNQSIASLNEGSFYHWRARTVSADPFFPRTPWVSFPGKNVTETKLRTAGCIDRDGDGYGDRPDPSCASLVPDCNLDNPTIWATPGESVNIRFTSKTVLYWDVPLDPGAIASALSYDMLRSGIKSNFLAADCVESDDGPNTTATDVELPSSGQAFYYLNRAQDSCPVGVGSLGNRSGGTERAGVSCP